MSGLFDDEGKTPARGRKHRAAEASMAELAEMSALLEDEPEPAPTVELPEPGHPFEDSIKAAKAIADDIHDPGSPGFEKIGDGAREQFNRLPISLERRERIVNLIWDRTRFRTGRVEWRDLRDLLKEVVEQL